MRDTLIDLFDREFVESQEASGITVFGQFRDLDDPDRFVWIRGFRDMPARAAALSAFYGGSAWRSNKVQANATMIASDDVLLLRPANPGAGLPFVRRTRLAATGDAVSAGLFTVAIHYLNPAASGDFVAFFERSMKPALTAAGSTIVGYFVTEGSANNFPALPVREGENVCVVISRFASEQAYENHLAALSHSADWCGERAGEFHALLQKLSDLRRLSPTARSRMQV